MTFPDSGQPGTPAGGTSSSGGSTTEGLKQTAAEVKQGASEAGQRVSGVARAEAHHVRQEAASQARKLGNQVRSELTEQASSQQHKAARGLRSVSEELRTMAESSQQGGAATDLVRTVAVRVGDVAGWLDEREPGALLDEAKNFARQRPGVFLAVAAGTGLLVGRLAKAVTGTRESTGTGTAAAPYAGEPAGGAVAGGTAVGGTPLTDVGPDETDPLYRETQQSLSRESGEYLR